MVRLPEIVGETWFNSKPLAPQDLKGKVTLVDFWTYSCVNCKRTLPYLREWWKKYKNGPFVMIGVHTPEFEFEKDPENVENAIRELGVEWPVVMDNEYANWNNFANHYWPAKYLADKKGSIVYTHFGEGGYVETERVIQKLVAEGGEELAMSEVAREEHAHGKVCFTPTPETYCGYERGRLGNTAGYREDEAAEYLPPRELPQDSIALSGKFLAAPEYVESAGTGATLFLRFRGTEVNLVLSPVGAEAVVQIFLDGQWLPKKVRGKDAGETGEVKVSKPTLYNLLKSKGLTEGVLSVKAKEGNFRAYAFTFSGCEE